MSLDTEQLTRQLAEKLTQSGSMICTAESCTGGLIAKTFTDLAGSSDWFDRGFVTYSNQAKMDMLGISSEALQQLVTCGKKIYVGCGSYLTTSYGTDRNRGSAMYSSSLTLKRIYRRVI